jgi:hypothetical protein
VIRTAINPSKTEFSVSRLAELRKEFKPVGVIAVTETIRNRMLSIILKILFVFEASQAKNKLTPTVNKTLASMITTVFNVNFETLASLKRRS